MTKFVAFLLLAGSVTTFAQWVQMTSIPRFVGTGSATAFGTIIFTSIGHIGPHSHTFNTITGVWITVPNSPVSSNGAVVASLTDGRAIVAAGHPSRVHIFNMQTLEWTSKTSRPHGRHGSAGDSDGHRLWTTAGVPSNSVLHEYTSDTDAWTTKAPLPSSQAEVAGAYDSGTFFVCGFSWIYLYVVALDVWKNGRSLPSSRSYLKDGVSAIAGYGFVVGADTPTSSRRRFERYDISNDAWTVLDPIPAQSWGTATAITSTGLLVAIGHQPGPTYVHGYTTGFAAAFLLFDPVLTNFDGHSFHRYLHPGVFNFFTTASLVVNILVETLDTLPPEENSVVTMVGIVAALSSLDSLFADCSLQSDTFLCSVRSYSNHIDVAKFYSQSGNRFTLSLPNYTLHVCGHSVALIADAVAYPTSEFFNIDVIRVTPFANLPAVGLLASSDSSFIESGCLYDVDASVFDYPYPSHLC